MTLILAAVLAYLAVLAVVELIAAARFDRLEPPRRLRR